MAKQGNITLKELSKRLNISVSTVSRALNDHPDISPATIKKVKNLAKELNYIPNLFAKGFRVKKTNTLGVVVPNICHSYTATILKGILTQAESLGYRVIISESKNNEEKQFEMLQTMIQFGVDGVLMSLARKTKSIDPILSILERIPLVLFDKVSDKIPCSQIVIDDEEASFNAVQHLIGLGKKRIVILKETENSYNSRTRLAGYKRALISNNIPIDNDLIFSAEGVSLESGKRITKEIASMKNRPDAIFAITDNAAIGAIQTLNTLHISIPDEIAVIGFSNSTKSTIISPSLTTINQPGSKIGVTAVNYLLHEILNPKETMITKTIEVKTNLVVRESTFKG